MIHVNTKLTKTQKAKLSRATTKFCRDWLRSEGYRYFMADPARFPKLHLYKVTLQVTIPVVTGQTTITFTLQRTLSTQYVTAVPSVVAHHFADEPGIIEVPEAEALSRLKSQISNKKGVRINDPCKYQTK
ncbi:MAG: hypothetical protein IT174_10560 [Acidobacteria bacterium]|nr:hypothetical protein [Acidobacteriota bacterium]